MTGPTKDDGTHLQSDESTRQLADLEVEQRAKQNHAPSAVPASTATQGVPAGLLTPSKRTTSVRLRLGKSELGQYDVLIPDTWGTIGRVSVEASNVVKRYLLGLLKDGHVKNKSVLAKVMRTSRGRLNAALVTGSLTANNINGLATLSSGEVSRVYGSLSILADRMAKGMVPAALTAEEEEFLTGRVDRVKFSGGRPSSSEKAPDDAPAAPGLRSKRPRQSDDQTENPED